MKIATMTSSFYSYRNGKNKITPNESIRRLRALGFEHIDLSLGSIIREDSIFAGDDWQEQAYQLREEAEALGVTFIQAHSPFHATKGKHLNKPEDNAHFYKMLMRTADICKITGVPTTVIHPVISPEYPYDYVDEQVRHNYEYYAPFLEKCDEYGICTCIENMGSSFGKSADNLLALMEAGEKEHNVGVCWDFGHAEMVYYKPFWTNVDQAWGIRLLKDRIKAVHIHDNHGKEDEHLLPFLGRIEWEKVLPALREAGFKGDLVLEVRLNANMPFELMDQAAALSASIARKLIDMFEEGK